MRTILELHKGLEAQAVFFSVEQSTPSSRNPTDSKRLEEQKKLLKKLIEVPSQRLKELGKKLGWGKKESPSIRYMAEKTGCLEIYTFFYHAASSSVMLVSRTFYAWCGGILKQGNSRSPI